MPKTPKPPKQERGKVSDSFGKPTPKPAPGSCPTCGANPPCRPGHVV